MFWAYLKMHLKDASCFNTDNFLIDQNLSFLTVVQGRTNSYRGAMEIK